MTIAAGTRLGPYELTELLGAGGMGEVFKARDTRLDRTVAVKILPRDFANDPAARDRFEREARTASALNHPNILSVFDVGRDIGAEFLVTELVEGTTLRARLNDGALPPREVVHLGAQIADGLAAAHAAGLIHRDLKPENVMVTRDGRVKILDFGLAKPLHDSTLAEQTRADISHGGLLVGTVGYISPEQVRGAPGDARSDLFSLGVVLYEMASGQRAFARPTGIETLNAVLKEDVPELPTAIPNGLRQIIGHCVEKEPARRFQTAQDVAFALRSLASTTAVVAPVPSASLSSTLLWASGAAIAAALIVSTGFLMLSDSSTIALIDNIRLTPVAVEATGEAHPAISPDGKSIAYVRDADDGVELVVKSDGSHAPAVLLRRPTSAARPVTRLFWSPSGDRIYYLGRTGLHSVSALGGDARDEIDDVAAAHVAPDGKTFALIVGQDTSEGRQTRFVVGPLDRLLPYEPAPPTSPCGPSVVRFSPDGRRILFWDMCATPLPLVLTVPGPDGNGTTARAITLPASATNPATDGASLNAATPGGDWLDDSRHLILPLDGNLWLTDSDGGTTARLTNGTSAAMFPRVGPNNRVVFIEAHDGHDVVELPMSGGAPGPVVSSIRYDGSPVWSPLGDRLAYVVERGAGDEIRVRHSGESTDRRLLGVQDLPGTHAWIRALDYSRDGRWLAFLAHDTSSGVRGEIWVVPADGGTPKLVTPKDQSAIRSSWSPDGRTLAVEIAHSPNSELWLVSIGSSDLTRKTALPAHLSPRYTEWSPTGEWIMTMSGNAPIDARPAVLIDLKTGATRHLSPMNSPALAWSRDGKALYGIVATPNGSELRAQDVSTGAIRTIAQYTARVPVFEEINGSLRLSLHPSGRSLVTSTHENRSNVWSMSGIQVPRPPWLRRFWEQ
jgi:eukaryotic-like serine/threonine-protein kinase